MLKNYFRTHKNRYVGIISRRKLGKTKFDSLRALLLKIHTYNIYVYICMRLQTVVEVYLPQILNNGSRE